MSKIAFLFLVRDDVNHPEIWENYMKGNEDKISIYCHPKNPEKVKTEWLKANIIPNLVLTEWGKITDAYFSLIHEALKNKENKKLIVVSESCVPLRTFDELYRFFLNHDERCSFIRFWRLKEYDIEVRLKGNKYFNNIHGESIAFVKHYARFCLSRYHALKLMNYTDDMDIVSVNDYIRNPDLELFNNTEVGDEFFLSILNPKKNVDFIVDYEINFDNWERVPLEQEKLTRQIAQLNQENKNIPIKDMMTKLKPNLQKISVLKKRLEGLSHANPFTYYEVTQDDFFNAKQTNSFFWRKFPTESNIKDFY
jgi:hypothetical protein